jgi:hypothetical protein
VSSGDNRAMSLGDPRVRGVVWGGLAVGVLDTLLAVGLYKITPFVVYQSVAGGLLGRATYQGGWATAALGMFLHFFIATTAAAVYTIASLKLPTLVRQPVPWGIAYGAAVYFFMNFVVLPLSAVRGGRFGWGGFIGHLFLVGLPIALLAARGARLSGAQSPARAA